MAAGIPLAGRLAKATRRYPACAIEEYASKRLMLSCTNAAILPIDIESAAATQISQIRPGACAWKKIRIKTANTAAFGAVDMKPTTGDGAPSYTSGVQIWNGAAATLKPSPTNISAMPR